MIDFIIEFGFGVIRGLYFLDDIVQKESDISFGIHIKTILLAAGSRKMMRKRTIRWGIARYLGIAPSSPLSTQPGTRPPPPRTTRMTT